MSVFNRIPSLVLTLCVIPVIFSVGATAQPFLEEVIVTAQKREQSLEEVPVAASAFNAEILTNANVKDIFDLQNIAPSLRIGQNQSATTSNFNIRGVGTSGSNFGLESSVGLYVDGAYRSRQSAIINNLVDIESVEVLRGPQGTLFGKNTPSGAILINSKKPVHEQEGFAELNIGKYSLVSLSGAYNTSVIEDKLAFRIAGFSTQRDGYVDDLNLGDETINDRDRFGLRMQFLYTPTENVEVRVIADYSEIDEICCAAITLVDSLFANSLPGPIPGTDSIIRALGGTTTTSDQFDNYDEALNHLPISQNEDRGLSVEVNWELENHTFTSITAWRSFDTFEDIDVDFTDVELFNRIDDAEQSSFSQEFRIANNPDNRLRYIGGLYYFNQDLDNDTTTTLGPFADVYFNTALASDPDFQQLVGIADGIAFLSSLPGSQIPAPVIRFSPTGGSAFNRMEQTQESFAVFGQLEYDLTEKLILTAGLRYTSEDKDLDGRFTQSADGTLIPDFVAAGTALAGFQMGLIDLPTLNGLQAATGVFSPFAAANWGFYLPGLEIVAPRPDIDATIDDEQVTGTIKLSWLPNEDTLLYASYGTGFKSGGTNTDRINLVFNPIFDAETSRAFEAGLKADFPSQNVRVHLAAHITEVEDFQSNAFQGAGFNLQNAGVLDTYGAELEVWWQPTESLAFTGAYVRSIADFDEFDQGNCWIAFTFHTGIIDPGAASPDAEFCDRAGDRVSLNPEDFFVLTATQEFQLSDSVNGYARLEWSHTGDQVQDANNDPFKIQDSYDILNLVTGVTFDQWNTEVILWARNLTDERYHNVAFDVPLQDGKLNAYPGEPRSYGLRIKTTF